MAGNEADFTGGQAGLIAQLQNRLSGEQSVTSLHQILQKQAQGAQTSIHFTHLLCLAQSETLAAAPAGAEVDFGTSLKWVLIDDGNAKSTDEERTGKNAENQPISLDNEKKCNYKQMFSQRKLIGKQKLFQTDVELSIFLFLLLCD